MKALKEKRLSLRSLLRGGIVILSLFALAFASCGDSGSDPTVPTDPTDPTNPTQPAAPTVTGIAVRGVSTKDSYQGQAPNLEGLFFQVTWSDGRATEFVDGKDAAENGFYTVPGYVDRYGDGAGENGANLDASGRYTTESTSPGYFRLAHKNGGVYSAEFPIYGSVPLALVLPGDGGGAEWYSDSPPDWSKIEIIGVYAWAADGENQATGSRSARYTPASGDIDGNTTYVNRKQMKLLTTDTYPIQVNQPGSVTGKTVTVRYGDPAQTSPNVKTTSFTLGNYYVVTLVEAKSIDPNTLYLLEDDMTYRNIGSQSPEVRPVSQKMINLMTTAKPEFTVYYTDGKSRTISWREFQANVLYRNPEAAGDPNMFFRYRVDGLKLRNGRTDLSQETWNNELTLNWNQDDYTWNIMMNYVGREWGTEAYLGFVRVPIPVFEFSDLNAAQKKYPSSEVFARFQRSIATITQPWPANDVSATNNGDYVFRQVRDMWTLTAVYERQGIRKTETLAWKPGMLNYGRASLNISQTSPGLQLNDGKGQGGGRGVISNWLENNGNAGFVASGMGAEVRDYYLPIYYRGNRLQDETEAVVVTLFIEGGRSY